MAFWQSQFGAVRRELRPTLEIALPLVVAELGWMSMSIVDTVMVGRLPNAALSIGSVALGSGLFYTTAIFGSGLLLGLDTLVSHAYGRKDLDDARDSLVSSLAIALGLAPILMFIVSLWPFLMRKLGVEAEIVRQMAPFLSALNWSTPPLLLYFGLRRYLQAVSIVKPITFALISANVINAVGNWIFIYGHWGAPSMGLPGSGWSTCAARVYMALVLLGTLIYYDRKRDLRLWATQWRVSLQRVRQLLALGFPAASQILFEIGVFSAATALCGKLGAVPLAGHQIALNCAAFTYMVPLGTASAAAVRVGQALGRGDVPGARRAGWTAIVLGAGFMTCAGLLFVCFPRQIARLYTPDPEVIRQGALLLLVAAAFQLFDGLQTVTTGALRGAGDTRTPMLANFIAYWLIGLPIGYVLAFHLGWGAFGLWIGLCVGLVLIGTFLLWIWHRRMQERVVGAARLAVSGE